jgi:hypothetical protein
MTDDTKPQADGPSVERPVGRPEPARVLPGRRMCCGTRYDDAHNPDCRGWRMGARGCVECGFGKVLGCWRCGSR